MSFQANRIGLPFLRHTNTHQCTSRSLQGVEVLNMETYVGRGKCERGAILIQVAISIMALTAFSAFVVDYGVLWVARGQAQNAADAGALAGAIALAYDDTTYPPTVHPDLIRNSAAYAALCASGSSSCTSEPSAADPVWPAQS